MSGSTTRTTRTTTSRRTTARNEVELDGDSIVFGGGIASVTLQRTLRVPETGSHSLPPGLGRFPLRALDTTAAPASMTARGGAMVPLYQREAMWISLDSSEPIAMQIATGLVCAVTGQPLGDRLTRDPQNYVCLPEQPWLDGFKSGDGRIRQFVAARLGDGATVEEQLVDRPAVGGLQLRAFRLRPKVLEAWRKARDEFGDGRVLYCMPSPMESDAMDMGLGAGGEIEQEVYPDDRPLSDWSTKPIGQIWLHLVGAGQWRALTGSVPPPTPITAAEYDSHGLPWFDYYDADRGDLPTASELASIRTVGDVLGEEEIEVSATPAHVVQLGGRRPRGIDAGDW